MEQRVKRFWADPRVRWNAVASLLTAILAYGYGMLNNLSNYDTSFNNGAIGEPAECSGRWTLGLLSRLANRIRMGFNLPYFNILVSLLLVWAASVAVCRCLRLSDRRAWGLIGVVTMSFPAVASMTFFSYTMVFYAVALLTIPLACCLVERHSGPGWLLLYAVLLALAVGVYQAYYPFAVMLAVLTVIRACLDPDSTPKAVLRKGLLYVAAILLSYGLYRLGLHLVLKLYHNTLVDYQGIDQMGHIELGTLPGILKQMYYHFFLLPTHEYLSLNVSRITCLCILLLFGGSAGMLALRWREKNRWKRLELAGLLLIALPIASNLIILMVPKGTVYTLMGMGLLSVFYLPILLWDSLSFPKPKLRRFFGLGLGAVLFLSSLLYVYQTNGCYRLLEWRNIQTENYFSTLYARIKSTPGYDVKDEVVFVGDVIHDESYQNPWAKTPFRYGGVMQFDSLDPENNGFNEYSRNRFIFFRLGYSPRGIIDAERERYASLIEGMGIYPSDGSICIVDGLVLVRFE